MRNNLIAAVGWSCLAVSATATAAMEDTTIGGKSYVDLTHISQKSDGSDTDATGTGLDVKRFYVSVDHKFDDMWSGDVTTDFNYVGNDGETQVYIKKAFLQAKVNDALVVRAGSADLPWVPFVENLYGYRYVENVLIDRTKFGTSADWGVHAFGNLTPQVQYAVSVINGGGYKHPTRSKGMDVEGRLSFTPMQGVTLAAGVYSGHLGKETETTSAEHTATRYNLLAAYVNDAFRVGAQYFYAKDWNQVTSPQSDKSDGYSVWGSINLSPQLAGFARYDYVKPSKDQNSSLKDNYYNIGLSYQPRSNVDLALVYKHDKVDNGLLSTSNGTIGGVNDGKYDEVGIWAQFKF